MFMRVYLRVIFLFRTLTRATKYSPVKLNQHSTKKKDNYITSQDLGEHAALMLRAEGTLPDSTGASHL